tara:strand:+ start:155 stop:853 length:699 start_codon:yes stop_codon:yes gene_type:complete
MKTMKLSIIAMIMLSACTNNQKNENKNPKHHEEIVTRDKKNNHSKIEEQDNKLFQKEIDHQQHESLQNNFSHKGIIILDNSYEVDSALSYSLKELMNAYLKIVDALVGGDLSGTNNAVEMMIEKVNAVDSSSFNKKGKKTWVQHASLYSDKLTEMQHSETLAEKRSYFSHISEIMYCTVKSFELKDYLTLYAAYCPMAFDGKGAYWLVETEEIKNPYFGLKMLKCGEIKEKL